ncbi:MAG: TraB/GumN family protein [Candidatus Thermoplasmatota archaeon]|nr:TraB/GumN family protein [Candidatus Thermoplasmatota archaeon]MBU1941425.1 TraB/GumN family protein [Candidatus Thermoplasmatota archaeon]
MNVTISDTIILIGTAHISQESVDEVKSVIQKEKPDIVAVELDERRYKTLTEKTKWENTPINQLLRSNNAYLMLAQIFLGSIQRRLGKELGVEPGSEMVAAMEEAKKQNLQVALVDRDITITLKRAWKRMGIREKFRLTWEFLKAMVGFEEEDLEEIDLKELMDQDMISTMMEEFGKFAPSAASVLIDERDQYIAQKIKFESEKGKVVAVVGAGHLKGIQTYLEDPTLKVDLKKLEHLPKKRFSIWKAVGYAVPIIFAVVIGYIIFTGNWERAADALFWWFIINGSLSALGTLIARGHPLSILTAFVAAPLTSLNPAVAAGWVAGYVEFKIRKPVVKDFQALSHIESTSDFLNNRVIRLLLVVALANLGSMIGTFIALPYLLSLGFGS